MDDENSRATSCFPSELKKTKHWRQAFRPFGPGLQKVMHDPKNTNANQPTAQTAKTNRPRQKHLNVGCAQLARCVFTWNRKQTLLLTDIQAFNMISTPHSPNSLVTFGLHSSQPCLKVSSAEGKREWALIAGKHTSGSDLTMLHKG